MKQSDLLWIKHLAHRARGLPVRRSEGALLEAQAVFLQELCDVMQTYAQHFNGNVEGDRPDVAVRVFRFGNPRPGLMILRGRDKLIICGEGDQIRARVVQVHAYNEQSLEVLQFRVEYEGNGDIVCRNIDDGQLVTPEVVVRHYLGAFLAQGSSAFDASLRMCRQSLAVQLET